MRCLLFRRIPYAGKNYYQLYKLEENFNPEDTSIFGKGGDSDYLYVEISKDSIFDEKEMYAIFEENNGNLSLVEDKKLNYRLLEEASKIYHDLKSQIKKKDNERILNIIKAVNEEIVSQVGPVKKLLSRLFYNQNLMNDPLPVESKVAQKSNIFFYGLLGSGKKSIVRIIENNLDIPYADVTVSDNVRDTVESIIKQLLSRSNDSNEVSHGVVFVQDNYRCLDNDDKERFEVVKALTGIGQVKYGDKVIDFRTITFVFLYDVMPNTYDYDTVMSDCASLKCDSMISTNILTEREKIALLLGKKGRIYQHDKRLRLYGKTLTISVDDLKYLINCCNVINPSVDFLNYAVEMIIKKQIHDRICDVEITRDAINEYMDIYGEEIEEEEEEIDEVNPKNKGTNYDLQKTYENIRQAVVGQDEQIKSILATIDDNLTAANDPKNHNPRQCIKNIVICGESGGGKTFIMTNIAKQLRIPYCIADATEYTEGGYVGCDVKEMLIDLYHNANDNLEAAERGLLIIDEIDKKADNSETSKGDVSRGAVLYSLLKYADGTKVKLELRPKGMPFDFNNPEEIYFDTSRLTMVCLGAFEGIEELRDERVRKAKGVAKTGFGDPKEERERKISKIEEEVTDKDLVSFGMRKQFVVRFPVTVKLNKNTKESLKNIMYYSTHSALKICEYTLNKHGIEVEYMDSFIDKLAEYAISLNDGVRGVEKVLQYILVGIPIFDVYQSNTAKIIFNPECIDDPKKIILIPREEKGKQMIKK